MAAIAYQNAHMFANPTGWLQGELVESGNAGYNRIKLPSGEIFSIAEGGGYDSRPADADGGWEQCKRSGNVLAFQHNDDAFNIHETYGIVIMEL
jgi:hypothetical protein